MTYSLYGVPHGILRVIINVFYENVFQNPPIGWRGTSYAINLLYSGQILFCT
jgi:hypothetical protein